MTLPSATEYKETLQRMNAPLDRQIFLCDNEEDVMMLATAMLAKAKTIFATQVGKDQTANLFRSIAKALDKEFEEENGDD